MYFIIMLGGIRLRNPCSLLFSCIISHYINVFCVGGKLEWHLLRIFWLFWFNTNKKGSNSILRINAFCKGMIQFKLKLLSFYFCKDRHCCTWTFTCLLCPSTMNKCSAHVNIIPRRQKRDERPAIKYQSIHIYHSYFLSSHYCANYYY